MAVWTSLLLLCALALLVNCGDAEFDKRYNKKSPSSLRNAIVRLGKKSETQYENYNDLADDFRHFLETRSPIHSLDNINLSLLSKIASKTHSIKK